MTIVKRLSHTTTDQPMDLSSPWNILSIANIVRIKNTLMHVASVKSDELAVNMLPSDKKHLNIASSNELSVSSDKYHGGLFTDPLEDVSGQSHMYNGLLYNDIELMRLLENEGYIQTYHRLKESGQLLDGFEFKIPNPEIYNASIGEVLERTKNKNIVREVARDLFEVMWGSPGPPVVC